MGEIRSMTGYGSAKGRVADLELTIELKSVNNRYLDCSVRLPRSFLFAEETVKQAVAEQVNRGKVDVFITVGAEQGAGMEVKVNRELAQGYIHALREIAEMTGEEYRADISTIARFPDVLSVEKKEIDKTLAGEELKALTKCAVNDFNTMRYREGERLKNDIREKAGRISQLVSIVEERSPQIVEDYRHRLLQRIIEVLEDKNIDQQRLITEAAIFADRTAVDEETVRLRSHLTQLAQLLEEGSPVGRKLDFLIQEFNREANTIGSKCNDATLAQVVVELKNEIEKIREQVQNIE